MQAAESTPCSACGAQVGPGLLSCPSCQRLVHAGRLSALADEAERASQHGRHSEALGAWREALDLLPANSRQAREVEARIGALSKQADAPPKTAQSTLGKVGAGAGAVALFVWKFKVVALALLTKGKFLLLGLTKLPTLLSMFVAFGAYWALWGWPFALGFVLCIYVHEMGHVVALRRYGIAATAPMFIPGFGAFVRMKQRPANAREDAMVGLAGPLWGLFASAACLGVSFAIDSRLFAALAHTSAWINLFNLLPVFSLDGGRGFTALARKDRLIAAAVLVAGWYVSADTLLLLIGAVAGARAFMADAPAKGERAVLLYYVGVVVALVAVGAASAATGVPPPG